MASTKEIKQRIKSVKNTKKITKAMELVAASKMRRAVSSALASRLYATYSWNVLTSLSVRLDDINHPFFMEKKEGKTLLILITSNTGLCGAYNTQVIKKAISMLKTKISPTPGVGETPLHQVSGKEIKVDIITVGKKGDGAMRRTGQNVIASFVDIPDNKTLFDIVPLSKLIVDEYKKGEYKDIFVAYTDFISALNQKANMRKLLPISKQEIKELIDTINEVLPPLDKGRTEEGSEKRENSETPYIFEGDAVALVESLAEKIIRTQIYQMTLESSASEQSSRMVAMKNATDAAGEMISDLTLVFNKARQAGITQEISEISAGMASVN
ncbi:MAG TPA: ATP synthase F1 subunit gamma [Candidatus Paceibacterota bacterium]|jgi:F-type H+-transporting ATPase subunit gamma|nr:ATP synthase F1 subunit gamma [Candidatus Paceibacterota bacterium]